MFPAVDPVTTGARSFERTAVESGGSVGRWPCYGPEGASSFNRFAGATESRSRGRIGRVALERWILAGAWSGQAVGLLRGTGP